MTQDHPAADLPGAADSDINGSSGPFNLDQIAESFVGRLRAGEHPSIKEYEDKYPAYAEEIRGVLPTLVALEKFGPGNQTDSLSSQPKSFSAPKTLGDYEICREVGRGGMGIVYEAHHQTMRRRVALKVLPGQTTENGLKRFLREARAAGQLHHTNIVPVFEIGQDQDTHFYAMQYIHGQNLDTVIEELQHLQAANLNSTRVENYRSPTLQETSLGRSVARSLLGKVDDAASKQVPAAFPNDNEKSPKTLVGGQTASTPERDKQLETDSIKLDESVAESNVDLSSSSHISNVGHRNEGYYQRVARIGIQVAEALEYAHQQGVVHRDIKPSNLILDTDGVVWVTDFGLAKEEGDDLTHTGDIVGTLRYMAPERFNRAADFRSDVYSLGLTLYELCTLQHAYDQKDRAQLVQQLTTADPVAPRKIRKDIPRDLETIILKAIERNPKSRYQNARQIRDDLALFIADRPITARRISTTERLWRLCRRNPIAATLATCIAALLLIVVVGSLRFAFVTAQHAQVVEAHSEELDRNAERLKEETARAKAAEESALAANSASQSHLYMAYLDQAKAQRLSGRVGRNFDSIQSIRKASETLRKLRLHPTAIEFQTAALRNEAIASLAFLDLKQVQRRTIISGWTNAAAVDHVSGRYAHSDETGMVRIGFYDNPYRFVELPSPGERAWVIRFSPDGKYLCAKYHHQQRTSQPIVCLWKSTGELIGRWETGIRLANFEFSSDSRFLAIGQSNGDINLYQTDSGQLSKKLSTGKEVSYLQFYHDNSELITAVLDDSTVRFWSLENGKQSNQVEIENESIKSMNWNETCRRFVVSTLSNDLLVWDEANPAELKKVDTKHRSRITRCYLNPNGRLVVTTSWDSTTRLIDIQRNTEVLTLQGAQSLFGGFDPTGKKIGLRVGNSQFGVWQLPETLSVKRMDTDKNPINRNHCVFHPKRHDMLLVATTNGVEVWNVMTRQRIGRLGSNVINAIVFNEAGDTLYLGGHDGVTRWSVDFPNTESNHQEWVFRNPQTLYDRKVETALVHESSGVLVVKPTGDFGEVLDLDTGKFKARFGRHIWMRRIRISPDGKYLATATWHGFGIYIWNAKTGNMIQKLATDWSTSHIDFHPHRPLLIAQCNHARRVYETDHWNQVSEVKTGASDNWVSRIQYSSSGNLCLTGFSRYVLQLIDPLTGKGLVRLELPEDVQSAGMNVSNNDQFLAVSDDQSVFVWDLSVLQKELKKLRLEIDETFDWQKNGNGPMVKKNEYRLQIENETEN